jgi:tetratricopeptide (TPR) repeat protein
MRQLEDLGTWKEMRWEILNSYSIGDWARAGKLYDRAEELGLLDKKEILLLRAQFNYLQIFGCIIAECLRFFFRPREFPDSRYGLGSLNWEPRVYERVEGVPIQDQDVGYAGLFLSGIYFSFGDEVFLIPTKHRGLLVGDREMDLEAYFEYYKTELERLHGGHDFGEELSAAVHDLERAIAGSPNPNPAYRSMLAKCYFMVGRYKEAAATYEAVHAAIREGSSLRLWSYMCTAISFQRAGKLDKAVEFLERCSSDFPNEAGIHFHKAKLYDKAGNLDGARESLLKAVELAPHLKNIFGVSLALAANSPDYDAIDSAIERHLNQNPEDARRLESFILSHWPTFTKLARLTENNWRGGVMMLYCMPMRDIILMQTLVTSGAHKLAIAVEVELRTTVFLKFREYVLGRPQLCELAQGVPKENKRLRPFADFLASGEPFALGQMNFVLQTCQKVEDPLFSEFKSWVQREFPSVLGLVSRLYQIKDTRNPLSHDGEAPITPEDFTVFCREILEGIAQRNVPAQAALPVESR